MLEYYDEVRIHSFPIRLIPKSKNASELFAENLEKLLREEDRSSADSLWFNLPTAVEGEEIGWSEKAGTKHVWIILLGLGAICAVIPAMRSEIAGREKKREEDMAKLEGIRGEKTNIEWGSQIRSYVFMPYTLAKDARTGYEDGDISAVMDGDIDGFINAYLKYIS